MSISAIERYVLLHPNPEKYIAALRRRAELGYPKAVERLQTLEMFGLTIIPPPRSERMQEFLESRRDEQRAQAVQRYREKNTATKLWKGAKDRATEKGLEFDLVVDDIKIPDVCPVLGILLNASDRAHTPSIDRIDNARGYTKDNIQIISWRANRLKNDASLEELVAITCYMLRNSKPNF